jgi:SagB-type dehydrogenase family enzyme
LSKAHSAYSRPQGSGSARDELYRLVELLSDAECDRLLSTVRDIAHGDRFWERDAGLFFNEFVKLRYMNIAAYASRSAPEDRHFHPLQFPPKSYPDTQRKPLPEPEAVPARLQDVLTSRRSRRQYADAPLPLSRLSTLLQLACGVTGFVDAYGTNRLSLRAFPSHGGLQSAEVYVAARRVEELSSGIYHLQPLEPSLELLRDGDPSKELLRAAFDEEFVGRAEAVLMISGCYERLRWKYGERSYRFICMDVGLVAQNLYLAAEALDLGACAVSGFAQDLVEELFGLDGKQELALMLFAVGLRGGGE